MASYLYNIFKYYTNLFSYYIFSNIIHAYFYGSIENNKNNKNISSFYEKTDNDISIIEVETNDIIDYENLINYLKHHILLDDSIFYNQYFVRPIFVKFRHSGQIYRICLKKLESKSNDHTLIKKDPKILSAVINNNYEIDITDTLREFHGNNKNYFEHIPDAISDLSCLLWYDGELHVYDMVGNISKYNIKNKHHKE
jgi:hypothetical protein